MLRAVGDMVGYRAAVLAALALLSGCGSEPSDEEQVRSTLSAFGKATADKDYERMCEELLAPALVEQVKRIGLPCEIALEQGLGEVRSPRLAVGRVTVDGERARAEVRTSAEGQPPSRDTVQLTKIEGSWRIASLVSAPGPGPAP
jgi:hypothetical protein